VKRLRVWLLVAVVVAVCLACRRSEQKGESAPPDGFQLSLSKRDAVPAGAPQ